LLHIEKLEMLAPVGLALSDGVSVQATFGGTNPASTAAPGPGELVEHDYPSDVVWFVHWRMYAHVTAPDGSVPAADERTTSLEQLRVE